MATRSPDAKRPRNAAFFLPCKKYLTARANASRIASNGNELRLEEMNATQKTISRCMNEVITASDWNQLSLKHAYAAGVLDAFFAAGSLSLDEFMVAHDLLLKNFQDRCKEVHAQ